MSKTSVVSYSLPNLVKSFIYDQSKIYKMPKGKFLAFLIEDYHKTKSENKNLKAYFEMATDTDFLKQQIMETEEDFLAEQVYNPIS